MVGWVAYGLLRLRVSALSGLEEDWLKPDPSMLSLSSVLDTFTELHLLVLSPAEESVPPVECCT